MTCALCDHEHDTRCEAATWRRDVIYPDREYVVTPQGVYEICDCPAPEPYPTGLGGSD